MQAVLMKYVRLIRLSIHERVIIDPLMPYFFFTSTCPFFTSYLMSDLFFLRVSPMQASELKHHHVSDFHNYKAI